MGEFKGLLFDHIWPWRVSARPVFFFFFFSVRSCLEELFSKEYYSSKVL
jgi:hypothetical protein